MGMDEIGLPESIAFNSFSRHLVRRMVHEGVPVAQAVKEVANRTDKAKTALANEMETRPIMVSRDPILHKYGMMGFRPKLTTGDVVRMSPLVLKPYGADADGDTLQFHVPTKQREIDNILDKMLPSRNLISPRDMQSVNYEPRMEFIAGLNEASRAKADDREPVVFHSERDVINALRRGEITSKTPVKIVNHGEK
jgi:DNA-directed RNA polymerase subunit beta'